MKTPTIRLCLRFYPERHAEHREIAEFFRAIRASGRQGDVGRHVEAALLAYLRGQPAPRRTLTGIAERTGPDVPEVAAEPGGGGENQAHPQAGAADGGTFPPLPASREPLKGEGGRSERNPRMAALVRNIHRDLSGSS